MTTLITIVIAHLRVERSLNFILFKHKRYYIYYIIYIITQVILAFLLVLAYDLLEDRRTIDVIVTKFFPPCFNMGERFENLDNILRDWAKDKVQKSLAEALNRFEKPEKRKIKPFLLENDTEIIF